jgi:tRNA-dihydrouridine synthase A
LAQLDAELFGTTGPLPAREQVVMQYADYVDRMLARGHRLPQMLRHAQGLYTGLPNARSWRRFLTEQGRAPGADGALLRESLRMFRSQAA